MALSMAEEVANRTLDPGYRLLGGVLDQIIAGCACSGGGGGGGGGGGSLAPPIVNPWVTELKSKSLDPACSFLADAIGQRVILCCGSIPASTAGDNMNAVKLKTLDPGAINLASVLDGLIATCC